ncbi:ABC transporter substrate-binding protein [Streptomyces xiamenensis]
MAVKARTGVFLGAVGLAVVALAGTVVLNVVQNSSRDADVVTWWVPDWDYQAAVGLVEKFEDRHPGVTVELIQTTGDTVANRTSVALESGNVPDVITESVSRIRGYAGKGQLADLSGLFGADLPADDFAPGLIDALTIDGSTYAVPYRWATNALIYNPELFAAAGIDGPPTTWEEFEADARALTSGNVVGTAWPVQGDPSDLTLRFLEFAVSGGASITDGRPELTPESTQAAVELIGGGIAEG